MPKAIKAKPTLFSDRTIPDRIAILKTRTQSILDHAIAMMMMHHTNRLFVYEDTLVKQIPRSYAANAYVRMQQDLHSIEVVRLCTLWDKADKDSLNIPTIMAILEDTLVQDTLIQERKTARNTATVIDCTDRTEFTEAQNAALDEHMRSSRLREADEEARLTGVRLHELRQTVVEIMASKQFEAVMNQRHRIAHHLVVTKAEKKGGVEVMKWGDEKWLYEQTIAVIEKLCLIVNDSSFDWKGARENAERCVKDLWAKCQLNIADREPRKVRG